MTRKQERMLLWLIGFNVFMLVVAPIGGVTIVQPMIASLLHD